MVKLFIYYINKKKFENIGRLHLKHIFTHKRNMPEPRTVVDISTGFSFKRYVENMMQLLIWFLIGLFTISIIISLLPTFITSTVTLPTISEHTNAIYVHIALVCSLITVCFYVYVGILVGYLGDHLGDRVWYAL